MRSFRVEFDEYFEDGIISEIEIGLGACGELRYPSYPAKHGWKYPGIGEFQVIFHTLFIVLQLISCIIFTVSGLNIYLLVYHRYIDN
jgi:hypothetical protein